MESRFGIFPSARRNTDQGLSSNQPAETILNSDNNTVPDDHDHLRPLDDARKISLMREWEDEMGTEQLRLVVCAVCSKKVLKSDSAWIDGRTIDFTLMQNKYLPDWLLPRSYSLTAYCKAILNPKGLQSTTVVGYVRLCSGCHNAILLGKMPKFALSNWLFYGHDLLPDDVKNAFKDSTLFDRMLISRARCNSISCKFNSKKEASVGNSNGSVLSRERKGIRGNVMVAPLDVVRMNEVIPPSSQTIKDTMCAIFVGNKLPTRSDINKYSPVLVSKSRVKKMILFLLEHNPYYAPREGFGFSERNLNMLFDTPGDDGLPSSVHIGYIPVNNAIDLATSDYTLRNVDVAGSEAVDELLMENVGYTDGDNSPQSYLAMKSAALERCLQGKPFLVSGRGSQLIPDFYNPSILTWLFPHLDPWGIGGFYHPGRRVKIGMQEQLSHLLLMDDSPFERDPEFAFVFYNVCQKAAVAKSLRFSVSQRQHRVIVDQLLSVDPEVLVKLNEQCQKNTHYKPTGDKEKAAFQLLSSIRMIARHIPGSDGYKTMLRNEIRSLINYRGAPTLFITLNPSDVDHPIVRLFTGENIQLEDISRGEDMSEWNRKLLAARNPSACARFFDLFISKFIKIILRYGRQKDGAYGKCEAYYGTVEAQGKGTLHLHMLVWLKGHPSPQTLRDNMESSEMYRNKVFQWLESIIKCEFPGSPGCELQMRNHPRRILHRESGDPHPGVTPILSVKHMHDAAGFWKEYNEHLTRLLYQYAWHEHQPTCWKYLERGQEQSDANCRMGMNGVTREATSLDPENQALLLRRLHPKIAAHTDVVTMLTKCNMDIKFVGSGEAAKAFLFYVTDYIMKPSLSVHVGMSALSYAVKTTHERIPSEVEKASDTQSTSAVISAVNSMMSRQEISHPQAMSYIVGGGDHYKSERFNILQWAAVRKFVQVKWATHEQVDSVTSEGGDSSEPTVALALGEKAISVSNQQLDYTLRGRDEIFENLCLYDFVSLTSKVRYKSAESIEDERPGMFISPDHPQCYTHYLTVRRNRHVPVILGPTIPNPKRSAELKEEWSRDMLVLFKPWRDPLDLRDRSDTWTDAFDLYRARLPELHQNIIVNMHVLTECGEARDTHAKDKRSRQAAGMLDDETLNMAMADNGTSFNVNLEDVYAHDPFHGLDRTEGIFEDSEQVVDSDSGHILSEEASRLLDMCLPLTMEDYESIESTQKAPSRVTDADQSEINEHLAIMNVKKKRKHREIDDSEGDEERPSMRRRHDSPIAMRATLLDSGHASGSCSRGDIADGIISEMSLAHNREQLLAFGIIAGHVIERNNDQLLIHVAGVGGTGKSHVIKSIVKLFERLDRRQELLLGAPTGIAAVLIGGQTLHSLILATPNGKSKDTSVLARIWKPVKYLIIDEVSMLGARFLSQLSNRLRLGKGDDRLNREKPFGGVNVIFMGDFAQLKPPKQFALYAHELVHHPSFAESRNEGGISAMNGAFLWRQVSIVIELIKNHRHREDATYAAFLSRLRLGQCVASDVEYLKSRLLENQASEPHVVAAFRDAPIIVGSKSLRDILNVKLVKYHAKRQGSEVRTYYSKDYVNKALTAGQIQQKLWSLSSTVNREAFGQLPLFIGMKVMVTENIAFDDGIVNGSEGIIHDIKFEEDESGRRYAAVAYVLISGCGVRIQGLPDDVVPIFPVTTRIEYTPLKSLLAVKSFARKQLPLVPGYAYTDFKSQGRTLKRAIVDLATARGQGVYVMLSRMKSLNGLLILRWFPPTKIYHRLPEELRNELQRLSILASNTAA